MSNSEVNAFATRQTTVPNLFARRRLAPSTIAIQVLAAIFASIYVLRVSLCYNSFGSNVTEKLSLASVASLLLVFLYILSGGLGRINKGGCLLLLATGTSLWFCEDTNAVLSRWLGWLLLLFALGPINYTRHAAKLRVMLFARLTGYFVVVIFLSVAWWAGGLPNLGRGDFTGVMYHSMTLGAIAALTGVIAISRAVNRGLMLWWVVYALSSVACLLASSRSALAALALGSLVAALLKLKRWPVASLLALIMAFTVAIAPLASLEMINWVLPQDATSGLINKGFNHSRELHWEARLDEFYASPIYGVGFAYAWSGTVGIDDETGTVETGSSYIAILSMTGLFGAAAFLSLAASLVFRVMRNWRKLSELQQVECCSVGAFWAVHLGAEGYVYAVGSLMGMVFWLWIGQLNDTLIAGSNVAIERTMVKRRPIVTRQRHSVGRGMATPLLQGDTR